MPVRSRKRMAEGHTPGEPMQPWIDRFFNWMKPEVRRNLPPDIDANHRHAAILRNIFK